MTNTGSTWLTSVDLADVTHEGPAVADWTADLSDFGGPAAYDFVAEGTWHGLIPPGASFFAHGTLTLGPDVDHANTVTVEAIPVVPEVGESGEPTGQPEVDPRNAPVLVTEDDGSPVRLTDSDPFHAYTQSVGGQIEEAVRDTLSTTGVGMALGGLFMLAVAAIGGGFAMVNRSRQRITT